MSIQAAQFAATFERLGRRMLAQLESFPEELWDRAPLIHHRDSLLTLATRLLDESDHWVLVVVGGQEMGGERSLEASSPDVRATLLQRYERWVTEMHRVLGHLPDAIMNLFVAVPPAYRETLGAESITVRACLLYALEQSGLLVGRIESLGQMIAEGQSLCHEAIAAREIDSRPDQRERDARETTNGGRAGVARNRHTSKASRRVRALLFVGIELEHQGVLNDILRDFRCSGKQVRTRAQTCKRWRHH